MSYQILVVKNKKNKKKTTQLKIDYTINLLTMLTETDKRTNGTQF